MAGYNSRSGWAGGLAGVVGLWLGLGLGLLSRAADAPPAQPPPARPQTAAEIIPAAPPAAENAGPLLLEAIAALETEKVWDTTLAELAAEAYNSGYGAAGGQNLVRLVESLHLPEEGNRSPTAGEVCEEFGRRLEGPAARKALALCAQAAALPKCWFPLDYSKGAETLLPHLAKLRNLSRFQAAAAYVLAEHDDAPTAWECIVQPLQYADLLRAEPLLISQLVRLAIVRMSLATLQDIAVQAPPNAEQWRQLDAILDRLDDAAPWAAALDGERLLCSDWAFAQQPEKLRELLTSQGAAKDAATLTTAQLAAEHAAATAVLVRLADLAGRPCYSVKDELAAVANPATYKDTVVAKSTLPALVTFCSKTAECQAALRVARIGLRLKAFQAEHGAYPAGLDALPLPGIAAEKQLDPCTGKALRYRPEGEGFVLYSLGTDGTDDGGKPRSENAKQGYDIVWQATR